MEKELKPSSTKEKVIDILLNSKEEYISGESISQKLGISRASVWKHIKSLKKEGFDIESKSGSGYILNGKKDRRLTPYEIKRNLESSFIGQNIEYFKTIDSTNKYAARIAEKSAEGTLVIADEQSAGRGRLARKWVSKDGQGLYFSIILKPKIELVKASFLTQVAGAALVKTFKSFGVKAEIKWPNDIILNGKNP